MKIFKLLVNAVLVNALVVTGALAQAVGENAGEDIGLIRVFKSVMNQIYGMGPVIMAAGFLVGLFFIWLFWGCMSKLSDEQARKQENLVPKMVVYFVAGAGLMFMTVMPVIMGESLFGIEGGPEVSDAVDTEKFGFKN